MADDKVVLTRRERKERIGHGGVRAIARDAQIDETVVSKVLKGERRHARVEAFIAARCSLAPNEIAFPPMDEATARRQAPKPWPQAADSAA